MSNIDQVKEILLQQLQVLKKNMTDEATKIFGFDQVLELAKAIERTAATYADVYRLQMMTEEPMENYIPVSSASEPKAETAE